MRPGLVLLTLFLAACFECEEVRTHVRWAPDEAVLHVERVYRNVPSMSLGCDDTPSCVDAVRGILERREDTILGSKGGLLGRGEQVQQVRARRRDQALDLVVNYIAPVGSQAALDAHTLIETEDRLLRSRPHIVVLPGRPGQGELLDPPRGARPRTWVMPDDSGELVQHKAWSLPPRVTSFTLAEQGSTEISPLFVDLPELDAALRAEGLLSP